MAIATDEMSAQVEELCASAQTLATVAEQLRAHTARFIVQRAPVAVLTPLRRAA